MTFSFFRAILFCMSSFFRVSFLYSFLIFFGFLEWFISICSLAKTMEEVSLSSWPTKCSAVIVREFYKIKMFSDLSWNYKHLLIKALQNIKIKIVRDGWTLSTKGVLVGIAFFNVFNAKDLDRDIDRFKTYHILWKGKFIFENVVQRLHSPLEWISCKDDSFWDPTNFS